MAVSDKLRELLVNPESENADIFSEDQTRELLFHVFKTLCVGGGVCQPDDRLKAYTRAAKVLYKVRTALRFFDAKLRDRQTWVVEVATCRTIFSLLTCFLGVFRGA